MFKTTAIFGGVQVIQVLITIIKSKFVAVLIGPTGMGLMGLFTTTTGFITSLTNFGLGTSAVKNIAEANASGDVERIRIVSSTLKNLVWITGLLGLVITAIFSPLLSQIAFGNKEYTLTFIILAPTLLLSQLTVGQLALLQGMRQVGFLSKANLGGALLGLIVAIPLYYFFGLKGIVMVIACSSISSLIISSYYSRKKKVYSYKLSYSQLWNEGKGMLNMGFVLNISSILTVGVGYILRLFISNKGGISEVGFYTAGFTILNTYVGMITNAIVADYYPRLSEVIADNTKLSKTVNQQTEILILLIAPILCALIIYIKIVLKFLYTKDFLVVENMMIWAAVGILFRTVSWAISYIFIAKADTKLFLKVELTSHLYFLPLQLLGYLFGGLMGIGIAFLISYIIYLTIVYTVSSKRYSYKFDRSFIEMLIRQLVFVILCLLLAIFIPKPYVYFIGALPVIAAFLYSYENLEKRMKIKQYVLSKLFKK